MTTIGRIISGGQTGADRGGLDAAMALGIPHGGWCPAGRLAEDGRIPSIYQLREAASASYTERTRLNVIASDATIVFVASMTQGSRATVDFCVSSKRPYIIVANTVLSIPRAVHRVRQWLVQRGDLAVLNIAGSRESKAHGIHHAVRQILVEAIA